MVNGKVENLRDFTDCMVDGIYRHPDGMRADRAGNIWASSNTVLGYSGVTGMESARKAARSAASAGRGRQCLFRRAQARSTAHRRLAIALCAEGQYQGAAPG